MCGIHTVFEFRSGSEADNYYCMSEQTSSLVKGLDEAYCVSCGQIIKTKAEICPKCGVRQKTAGFIAKFTTRIKNIKTTVKEEEARVTGISTFRKVLAIIVAISAGWTGITGLGSIIAGRPKAGFAMFGIPFFMGLTTAVCMIGWVISLIFSIVLIGVPFLLFFTGVLIPLIPLTVVTWSTFYIADIGVCIRSK